MICVSNHARHLLSIASGVPIEQMDVVPHGVSPGDPSRVSKDPRIEDLRKRPYLLQMGQPIPYRRTRQLIEGYKRLVARRSGVPALVIVGTARAIDQAYGDECRRAAEPLVRDGRIVMLPQVSHADSMLLASGAHAIVYPSVHEDCPNAVLEALACGRVLVCADIPAMRELADDAAIYLANPNGDSIADGIEAAISDEPLRERLQASALRRGKLFTWDQTVTRTAAALDAAFDARRTSGSFLIGAATCAC